MLKAGPFEVAVAPIVPKVVAPSRYVNWQLLMVMADTVAILGSFASHTHQLPLVACGAGSILLGLYCTNLYQLSKKWSIWQIAYETCKGAIVSSSVLFLLYFLLPGLSLMPYVMAISWCISFLSIVILRTVALRSVGRLPKHRAVVIGAGDTGSLLSTEIFSHPDFDYQIVGFVDDDSEKVGKSVGGHSVLGQSMLLPSLVELNRLDTVIIATTRPLHATTQERILDCLEHGVFIQTLPGLYEKVLTRIPVNNIDSSWFIQELKEGERKPYALVKRALDVIVAVAGLFFTGLIFPAILLALKFAGGAGPIFYSQERVGYRGSSFKILKFRTMRLDAEKNGAVWAAPDDERVTPVGRLLRRTRLDELPQFWNVLVGEMSIVGPRPERPEFVAMLEKEIPFYNRRHMVLPGLTGWAQVKFSYGASVADSLEKMQYDLFYIKNRSFYLDLKIMVKTIFVMILKIGSR